MSYHLDWLKIYQDFETKLPVISDSLFLVVDPLSGDVKKEYQPSFNHEGSFSTTIQIRISGNRITVSGNPSRFDRLENLFGLTSIEACVNVYNRILSSYGLPSFTKNSRGIFKPENLDSKGKPVPDGAVIQELHITSNVSTGADNASDFVRALSTLPYRHSVPRLHTNGNTVDWLSKSGKGSTLIYPSAYIKSRELALHALPKIKKKFGDKSPEFVYLQKVISYCASHGVVRFEQKLKSLFLSRNGLNFYGSDISQKLASIQKEFLSLPDKLQVVAMDFENISQQLISKKVCGSTLSANTTAMYFVNWMHGATFDSTKSQVRTHRARLRKIGYDIFLPFDATKHGLVQVKRARTVQLAELKVPSWYKAPRAHLQLVA